METDVIKKPSLVLAATPIENVEVQDFFHATNNKLFDLLKDPPYLRYSGWNMLTLDFPKIKDGSSWFVTNGGRKDIQLYNDLSLILRADATEELLGWGNNHAKFEDVPLLNTLAIIELTFEFVNVYKKMLETLEEKPNNIGFGVSFFNTTLPNGKKLRLKPYEVTNTWYFIDDGKEIDKDFEYTKEVKLTIDLYDPKYVALQLVTVIFTHFNIASDSIPYTGTDENGKMYIDTKKFGK